MFIRLNMEDLAISVDPHLQKVHDGFGSRTENLGREVVQAIGRVMGKATRRGSWSGGGSWEGDTQLGQVYGANTNAIESVGDIDFEEVDRAIRRIRKDNLEEQARSNIAKLHGVPWKVA
jgi:hypothetical protein